MDSDEQVCADFARRRRNQWLLVIPVVALLLAVGAFSKRKSAVFEGAEAWKLPVTFGVVLAAVAYSFYNWRCPACRKYLGRGLNPRFCPACGVQLRP